MYPAFCGVFVNKAWRHHRICAGKRQGVDHSFIRSFDVPALASHCWRHVGQRNHTSAWSGRLWPGRTPLVRLPLLQPHHLLRRTTLRAHLAHLRCTTLHKQPWCGVQASYTDQRRERGRGRSEGRSGDRMGNRSQGLGWGAHLWADNNRKNTGKVFKRSKVELKNYNYTCTGTYVFALLTYDV